MPEVRHDREPVRAGFGLVHGLTEGQEVTARADRGRRSPWRVTAKLGDTPERQRKREATVLSKGPMEKPDDLPRRFGTPRATGELGQDRGIL